MSRYTEISQFRKSFDIITNWAYYPIASYLCALFSFTAITPNQITFLAILSELSAIYFIITGFESHLIIIVILLQLGWVFDLMDGMMARYKKLGIYHPTNPSIKGYYLDAISDHALKFMILGALTYQFSLQNESGWLIGLITIIIHGITQTEHTLRKLILKSRTKLGQEPKSQPTIAEHIILIMNNIYLFYLVFILINRIDILLVTFAGAELILLIKRVFQFWQSKP